MAIAKIDTPQLLRKPGPVHGAAHREGSPPIAVAKVLGRQGPLRVSQQHARIALRVGRFRTGLLLAWRPGSGLMPVDPNTIAHIPLESHPRVRGSSTWKNPGAAPHVPWQERSAGSEAPPRGGPRNWC